MKIFGVRKRFYYPPLIVLITAYIIAAISPMVDVYHVYKLCPAFVVYTDQYLVEGSSGTTRGIVVLIHPDFKDTSMVLDHELIHVKQAYRTLFTDWILCSLSQGHHANREAEAYATQIVTMREIPELAKMIKDEYAPKIEVGKIEKALFKHWEQQQIITK